MPNGILVKSILNKTKRRDPWFLDDYTINPYSGCSFNCLYCYIRGSKYGINMADRLSEKLNAVDLLEKQLGSRAKRGQYGFIVLSSVTDPYLQAEATRGLTRELLEVIRRYRFPVHIITKSDLVTRDFDLLHAIDAEAVLPEDLRVPGRGTLLTFSFSTIDATIAKIFEPGAPSPERRLTALKAALGEGFHAGVSLMPLLPYITDTGEHLQQLFRQFAETGVQYIFPASVTLWGNEQADSRTLMFRAVEKYYPHLLEKYRRLFDNSEQMPAYYKEALAQKTQELAAQYGLRTRII